MNVWILIYPNSIEYYYTSIEENVKDVVKWYDIIKKKYFSNRTFLLFTVTRHYTAQKIYKIRVYKTAYIVAIFTSSLSLFHLLLHITMATVPLVSYSLTKSQTIQFSLSFFIFSFRYVTIAILRKIGISV